MIKLENLTQSLKPSAEKATAELDRMIAIHERKAAEAENRIKRYLLKVASDGGEALYKGSMYGLGDNEARYNGWSNKPSPAYSFALEHMTVEALKALKEKLEK